MYWGVRWLAEVAGPERGHFVAVFRPSEHRDLSAFVAQPRLYNSVRSSAVIRIRKELAGDEAAVRRVNLEAFGSPAEAEIVDALRRNCEGYLGFVATSAERVVGHILFTPVTLDRSPTTGMGLAPMAVAPELQNLGIGSRLVREGLEHLRESACPFVIVLGHPDYYPRFGFRPAVERGLVCQWDGVPDEAFMILVLEPDAFPQDGGVVRYRREFDRGM